MSIYDVLPEFAECVWEDGHYDWEWMIDEVFFDPAGLVYYWYGEVGCSCSSYGDYVETLSELGVGNFEEAVAWAHKESYSDQPKEQIRKSIRAASQKLQDEHEENI